ncbi:MAG: hypothetical protein LLG14_27240 [Nocardiaceae bacterium]|nr:hypothetical protein [Nocardiaceae bacterium]
MYHGDIRLGDTIDIKFCTVATTGAPTTLAGTPSVAAYPGNSTTEITAGITLTVDFDSRTGMHNVRVVASSGNGYATATNYTLVITAGTVGGTSVVGYCIGSFSVENRSAVMPTTAGRTLDVSATGEAGVDWANVGGPTTSVNLSGTTISTSQAVASVSGAVGSVTGNVGGNVNGSVASVTAGVNVAQISGDSTAADNLETLLDDTAGPVPWMGILDQGTAQSATGNDIVLRAANSHANDTLIGATIMVLGSTQGYWQAALISDHVNATDTVTVTGNAGYVTPSGTITYKIFATAASSGGSGLDAAGVRAAIGMSTANMDTQLSGIQSDTNDIQTRLPAALVSGRIDASVGAMAANVLTATAINADAITAAKVAADVTTEIQSGLATAANLATVDTVVNAILVDTGTTLQGVVDTIQADTDDIQARLPAVLVGGRMASDVGSISTDATAADNLEAALDGTGGVTITAGLTGNVTGNLSGSVGSVTGAVGSVTTVSDKTGYRLSATGVDDILDEPITEPSGVFAWAGATLRNIVAYVGAKASNRQTETATTYTLRNRANSADIATSTNSDDGTTTVKGSDA